MQQSQLLSEFPCGRLGLGYNLTCSSTEYIWRMMLSASDQARKFLQPRIVPHARGEDHRERRSDQMRQQLDGVCMYSRYFNTISSMQPSVIFPYVTRLGHVKMMFKCSKDIQLGAKPCGDELEARAEVRQCFAVRMGHILNAAVYRTQMPLLRT